MQDTLRIRKIFGPLEGFDQAARLKGNVLRLERMGFKKDLAKKIKFRRKNECKALNFLKCGILNKLKKRKRFLKNKALSNIRRLNDE